MGIHSLEHALTNADLGSTASLLYSRANGGRYLHIGASVPTDASSGYPTGAIYLKTDGGVGSTMYVNEGSSTSCDFNVAGGSTSSISTGATLNDASGLDALLTITDQTSSQPTLTIPDMAGTSSTFVFTTLTQTLTNKTLTTPIIATTGSINDAGGDEYLVFVEDSTPVNYIQITSGDTGVAPIVGAGGDNDNIDLQLTPKGTGNVVLTDGTDSTKALSVELNGATTAKTLTISSSHTDDRTLTIPDLTGTVPSYAGAAAQGEVLYYNGSAWTRLGVGTSGQALLSGGAASNVSWGAPSVAEASKVSDPFTIEAGTNDITVNPATQTQAETIVIPDMNAGASHNLVLDDVAATLASKTLTSPIIVTTDSICDGGGDPYLTFVEDSTPRDSFQITTGDAGVGAKLEVITDDTNANMLLDAAGSGDIQICNGTELSFLRATQHAHIVVADQTGEAHTFNIPDIATGASDTFVFLAEAQTLTNKTLTSPVVGTQITMDQTTNDAIIVAADQANQDNTYTIPDVDGNDSFCMLAGTQTLTNKTLTSPVVGTQITMDQTTNDAIIVAADQTNQDNTYTIPDVDGDDTFVFRADTATLTNKTIDVDSNTVSNINADELDEITPGTSTYGIDFVITKTVANADNLGTDIFTDNAPFKFRVIDAWSIATSADGGTWKLHKGKVGALGNAITDVVTVAASDTDIDRIGAIDNAEWEIAENGSLTIVADAGGTLDGLICVRAMRVD